MSHILRVLAAAAILATAALPPPPAIAQTARTLTVTGEGRADGVPDRAQITSGVVTEAATAAEAVNANTAVMNQVHATLEGAGVAAANVQTTEFSVQPMYAQRRPDQAEMPRITGYRVSNMVRVTVTTSPGSARPWTRWCAAAPISCTAFPSASATPVRWPRPRAAAPSRTPPPRRPPLASAAGVRLGAMQSIEEPSTGVPVPVMRMAQAEMAVPVAPGEMTVRVSVTVIYAIE